MIKNKKFFQFIIVLLITLGQFGCTNNDDKLLGEWIGKDKNETINFIFDNTKHATLIIGNQVIGGSEFQINGTKGELKYDINYTKEPIWLDFIVSEKESNVEKGRIKAIVRFLSDTKIECRINFRPSSERFKNFDSEDKTNTIVLDKVIK